MNLIQFDDLTMTLVKKILNNVRINGLLNL